MVMQLAGAMAAATVPGRDGMTAHMYAAASGNGKIVEALTAMMIDELAEERVRVILLFCYFVTVLFCYFIVLLFCYFVIYVTAGGYTLYFIHSRCTNCPLLRGHILSWTVNREEENIGIERLLQPIYT